MHICDDGADFVCVCMMVHRRYKHCYCNFSLSSCLELSLYLLHDKLVEAGIEAEREAGGQDAQETEAD